MISLFLSVCILGQPCKEERIADFHTVMAVEMCDTNKISMQRSADAEKRKGTFECRTTPQIAVTAHRPATVLNFNICVAGQECETLQMAKFYGSVAKPLCAKTADHYRPGLVESANATGAKIKLDCGAA